MKILFGAWVLFVILSVWGIFHFDIDTTGESYTMKNRIETICTMVDHDHLSDEGKEMCDV